MKLSHRISANTAGPAWGLAFGLFVSLAGVGLWCDAKMSAFAGSYDEPLGIAAVIIGVFAAIFAAHELRRR
jgi:hypothetical protein